MKEKSDESKGSKAACEHTLPLSIESERKNVLTGCYPKFLPYFLVSLSLLWSLLFWKADEGEVWWIQRKQSSMWAHSALEYEVREKCTCWLLPKVSTVSFWFSSALVVQLGRAPTIDLECCSPPCCLWIWFPVATYVKEIFSAEHKNTVTEFWVIEFVS